MRTNIDIDDDLMAAAMAAGGFVDMEHATDIRAQYFFERALHRNAAKVQDGVDALYQLMHGVFVGQVAGVYLFASIGGGGHFSDIRKAQHLGIRTHAFTQDFAQAAGGTSEQQTIEGSGGGGGHGPSRFLL